MTIHAGPREGRRPVHRRTIAGSLAVRVQDHVRNRTRCSSGWECSARRDPLPTEGLAASKIGVALVEEQACASGPGQIHPPCSHVERARRGWLPSSLSTVRYGRWSSEPTSPAGASTTGAGTATGRPLLRCTDWPWRCRFEEEDLQALVRR